MNKTFIVLMRDKNGVAHKHEVDAPSEYLARKIANEEREDMLAESARLKTNTHFNRNKKRLWL